MKATENPSNLLLQLARLICPPPRLARENLISLNIARFPMIRRRKYLANNLKWEKFRSVEK